MRFSPKGTARCSQGRERQWRSISHSRPHSPSEEGRKTRPSAFVTQRVTATLILTRASPATGVARHWCHSAGAIPAPSDLASVEPRSGNQNAKQKCTLAPACSRRGSQGLASATWSMTLPMAPADRAADASKPSVPRHEAGGAVLADSRFSSGFQTSGPPA